MSEKNAYESDESPQSQKTSSRGSAVTINVGLPHILLAAGASLLVLSVMLTSYFSLFIGIAFIFWGGVLLYVAPSKQVPLELLVATSKPILHEIHKTLSDQNLESKGVYLPPGCVEDPESVMIYVSLDPRAPLPGRVVPRKRLPSFELKEGLLLTPPGFALSNLFEKKLKASFTKMNLKTLKEELPKSLTESWEIVEDAEMLLGQDLVIFESRKDMLEELHQEAVRLNIHETIGYALSSAIACAIAKAAGSPVIIEGEGHDSEKETTRIVYRILEG